MYDITEFVDVHPGGKKILLAAGASIDPFWNMYQQVGGRECGGGEGRATGRAKREVLQSRAEHWSKKVL